MGKIDAIYDDCDNKVLIMQTMSPEEGLDKQINEFVIASILSHCVDRNDENDVFTKAKALRLLTKTVENEMGSKGITVFSLFDKFVIEVRKTLLDLHDDE